MAASPCASDIPLPPRFTSQSSLPRLELQCLGGGCGQIAVGSEPVAGEGKAGIMLRAEHGRVMSLVELQRASSSSATTSTSPPETPRWGFTPSTDFDEDTDVASDNENSSAMSFDGESVFAYPASAGSDEVIEDFLHSRGHSLNSLDSHGCDELVGEEVWFPHKGNGCETQSGKQPPEENCIEQAALQVEDMSARQTDAWRVSFRDIDDTEDLVPDTVLPSLGKPAPTSCNAQAPRQPSLGAIAKAVANIAEVRFGFGAGAIIDVSGEDAQSLHPTFQAEDDQAVVSVPACATASAVASLHHALEEEAPTLPCTMAAAAASQAGIGQLSMASPVAADLMNVLERCDRLVKLHKVSALPYGMGARPCSPIARLATRAQAQSSESQDIDPPAASSASSAAAAAASSSAAAADFQQGDCDGRAMSSALQCPQGHILFLAINVARGWICDGCGQLFSDLHERSHRCECCDYDLCKRCAEGSPLPHVDRAAHPCASVATQLSPRKLHDSVAMPLMKHTQSLGLAYKYLEEVNARHLQLHGIALPEAMYNQACCLSLGTDAILRSGVSASPGLPPWGGDVPIRELAERRLDLALERLSSAVSAGYAACAHMWADPDLKALRELRPVQFSAVVIQTAEAECPDVQRPLAPTLQEYCCSFNTRRLTFNGERQGVLT